MAEATRTVDVCIIGAGAVGLYLADLLSRDGATRVAIVEAGPERFEDRKEPFFVESTPKFQGGVNEGRVTALGGATNTWGGGMIRLTEIDFRALADRPDTGWPIDYGAFERHYIAAEQEFDVAPPPPPEREPEYACGDVTFKRRDIPILPFRKKNFRLTIAPKLKERSNVELLYDASIERYEPGGDGLKAIDVRRPDADPVRIEATRFVVTAGVVNSYLVVRDLLEACVSPERAAATGTHFHDHVSMPMARVTPRSRGAFSKAFAYRFGRGLMFGEHFDGDVAGSVHPGAFFHFTYDFANSKLLTTLKGVLEAIQRGTLSPKVLPPAGDLGRCLVGLPQLGVMRFLRRRLFLDEGVEIVAAVDLEQVPLPAYRLETHPGADGRPGCRATWDVDDLDVANAALYFKASRTLIERLQAEAAFDVEELFPDPDRDPDGFATYIRESSESAFHASGCVRMGTDPATSFVAPDLHVHDVENVSVISTAVFPRAGTSNPTLTILALAHKWAEDHAGNEAES